MSAIEIFNFIIMCLFFLCYSYQFFYIPVSLVKKHKPHKQAKLHRYAVLIAARNERAVIGELIDSIRAEKENVILVDAGDAVQGSLFFTIYKGELEEKLMNALGYDIRILGNHEFDNGLQRLADNLAVADAELLCLNYDFAGTPLDSVFKPYTIREMACDIFRPRMPLATEHGGLKILKMSTM